MESGGYSIADKLRRIVVIMSFLCMCISPAFSIAPAQQPVVDSLTEIVKAQNEAAKQNEQNYKDTLQDELSAKHKVIFGFILAILILGGACAYTIYRITQYSRRKNELIFKQKAFVEGKQKEVIDSINYAKRIQKALLKEEERVTMHLPDHFILFMPKDIVSGDFYWALEKEEYFYITAADCTGHGIPGGFMSMLGIAFLNEITSGPEPFTPSVILNKLRDKILKEFGRTGSINENQDGMDISLLRMNLKTRKIQWSGANNPLWYINKGKFNEILPNKQPVGYYPIMKLFTNHILEVEKDTMFYLFSDGYADQFGGAKGKKFKAAQMKEVLLSIYQKPMDEQKKILRETFKKWKGKLEQVDDILVIGIKV
jgi:serine phosphatase RsbU (regulator of sigma subunit)